jgi:hypothetical protein
MRTPLALLAAAALTLAGSEYAARRFERAGCAGPGAGESFELYAVGDSTPAGIAYGEKLSFPSVAASAFDGRLTGRPIRLVNVARPGETIYAQAHRLESALRCRDRRNPGALVLYSGHNDFVDPGEPLGDRLETSAPSGSALLNEAFFFRHRRQGRRSERGWSFHLERVEALARSHGLHLIVALPAANLAGVDPGLYREDPASAYRTFELAARRRAEGRFDEARELYWRALDESTARGFGRASRRRLAALREFARRGGASVLDAVGLFESRSAHGLIDDALFIDGHHPNLAGTALLADALAEELGRRFGERPKRRFARGKAGWTGLPVSAAVEASGLVYAGRWFLAVSVGHLSPKDRLALAEDRFRRAGRLDPADYSGALGLCLVDVARRGADLTAVLGKINFYGRRFELAPSDFADLVARLRAAGVAEPLVDAVVSKRRQ